MGGWGKNTWCMGEEGKGKQKKNFKCNQMSDSGGVAYNSFTNHLSRGLNNGSPLWENHLLRFP